MRRLFKQYFLACLAGGFLLGPLQAALETEPTPFTALLDFTLLRGKVGNAYPDGLPIWLESVEVTQDRLLDPSAEGNATPFPGQHTTFRLRLRPLPGLTDALYLRLFFRDKPYHQPVVTGWTETGNLLYTSRPLGNGLNLLTSEGITIPAEGIDYLEINVPGDGSTLRQALITSLRPKTGLEAIDFPGEPVPSAETGPPSPAPAEREEYTDTLRYGRVRAVLDPGVIKIDPGFSPEDGTLTFEFELASAPLMAMVTFEILNADPAAPLQAWVNEQTLGPVAVQLPDLSDPGYTGIARSLEPMAFQYAGWVKAQKVIPGRYLRRGENRFSIRLPHGNSSVAIRNVEIQLKHPWKKLDYILSPL